MAEKPTYEELEKRVKELEKEVVEQGRLEERMQLLLLAVEQSSEGIAVVDMHGNLEYLNTAFAKMHGYCPGELVGKNLSIFHTPEQMPSVEAANRETKETGDFKGEIGHVRRDGTFFPTSMHNSLVRNDACKPIGIIGTLHDSSDIKQVEDALRESEEKWRTLAENVPGFVSIIDSDGKFVFLNRTLPGFTMEKVIGSSVYEYTSTEYLDELREKIKKVFKTKEAVTLETKGTRAKGITGWYESYIGPITQRGQVDKVIFITQKIPERKKAEEQIKASLREKEVLLGEIHHRVKNNMQVITSLLRLQAANIEEKKYADMFKDSLDRIQSMALVHEKLYQSKDFENIDFKEYVKTLLSILFRTHGVDTNKIGILSIFHG